MSSCDCDSRPDVGGEPKLVKARKQYWCYECGQPILGGAQYEFTSGLWDGDYAEFDT
jgi:hypothetical protein